jgi:hypothetical protein
MTLHNADTGHVIYCSLLHPATPDDANLRGSMFAGEPITNSKVAKSCHNFPPTDMGEYKQTCYHTITITSVQPTRSYWALITDGQAGRWTKAKRYTGSID